MMGGRLGWALLLALGLPTNADAHLMSRGHGTLNVVKDTAYIVVSLPIAAFADGPARAAVTDGVLTAAELKAYEAQFRAAIRAGMTVHVGARQARFKQVLLNLPKGDHHTPDRSTELTAMILAPLGEVPKTIELATSLWDQQGHPLKIRATVTEGGRTIRKEIAELTPKAARHRFFSER